MSARTPLVRARGPVWPKMGRLALLLAVAGVGLCLTVVGLGAGILALGAALVLGASAGIGQWTGGVIDRPRQAAARDLRTHWWVLPAVGGRQPVGHS